MRQYFTDILVSVFLVIVTLIILVFAYGQSVLDIQLHDTYLILDTTDLIILIVGPLTFLIFLALGLTRRFRTVWTNSGLIIGLILVSIIIFRIINFQRDYRDQISSDKEFQFPNKGQLIREMDNKINWTWGVFGLFILGIGLTGTRTVKLIRER